MAPVTKTPESPVMDIIIPVATTTGIADGNLLFDGPPVTGMTVNAFMTAFQPEIRLCIVIEFPQ